MNAPCWRTDIEFHFDICCRCQSRAAFLLDCAGPSRRAPMDRFACSFASAEKSALHGFKPNFLLDSADHQRRAPIERPIFLLDKRRSPRRTPIERLIFLLDYADLLRCIPMERSAGIFVQLNWQQGGAPAGPHAAFGIAYREVPVRLPEEKKT